MTFAFDIAPKDVLEAINYLHLGDNNLNAEVIRSCNVVDSENDYSPNILDDDKERAF